MANWPASGSSSDWVHGAWAEHHQWALWQQGAAEADWVADGSWSEKAWGWPKDEDWQKDEVPKRRKRELKECPTDEGKTYDSYTYLGGTEAGSLRDAEKAKAISCLTDEGISRARSANWPSVVLDAVMYLLTALSTRTRVHALPTDAKGFRAELRKEFRNRFPTEDKVQGIIDLINQSDDSQLLAIAAAKGFVPFEQAAPVGSRRQMSRRDSLFGMSFPAFGPGVANDGPAGFSPQPALPPQRGDYSQVGPSEGAAWAQPQQQQQQQQPQQQQLVPPWTAFSPVRQPGVASATLATQQQSPPGSQNSSGRCLRQSNSEQELECLERKEKILRLKANSAQLEKEAAEHVRATAKAEWEAALYAQRAQEERASESRVQKVYPSEAKDAEKQDLVLEALQARQARILGEQSSAKVAEDAASASAHEDLQIAPQAEQEQQEEPSLGGAPSPKDEEVEEGRAADESVSEGVQEELAEQLGVE